MAPTTTTQDQLTTITNHCQPVPTLKEYLMATTVSALEVTTSAPASSRVSQRVPLWLTTNPHTPDALTWLIVAWERRGDLLAAAVVAEDADMTYLETWPLYIQDGDLITTTPETWTPQGPPVRWALDTDGEPLFWAVSGWTWSAGNLDAVVTLYDADDLTEKGLGLPVWSCKDTDGCWLEGYARGWSWDAGQLTPECSLENGESLDMWESIIRPTRESLGI